MIFDLNDNPITSADLSVAAAAAQIFTLKIECRAGYFLRSDTAVDLAVEARREGDTAWTNIETGEIDLSAWNGTRQIFEIRLTAANLTALDLKTFALKVERQ